MTFSFLSCGPTVEQTPVLALLAVALLLSFLPVCAAGEALLAEVDPWEQYVRVRLGDTAPEEQQGPVSTESAQQQPTGSASSVTTPSAEAEQIQIRNLGEWAGLDSAYQYVDCPQQRTRQGNRWQWYLCNLRIAGVPELSPYGHDMPMSYTTPLAEVFSKESPARLMIYLHPSDRGRGHFVTEATSFLFARNTLELHLQEERFNGSPGGSWWGFSGGSTGKVANYNGRRMVAAIDYLESRYSDSVDWKRGIHLRGKSLGGAGVMHQPLILPRHVDKIAIVESLIGHMIMPICCRKMVSATWGNDRFDEADIRLHWQKVSHIHFYWRGGANDHLGRFDLDFFKLCERRKISCSGYWLQSGHSFREKGYKLKRAMFTDPEQDVSLDRLLPVITNSTANYHGVLRGYHNRGITWQYSGLVDSPDALEVPLKYVAMKNIGPKLPDQPQTARFSVTLRRVTNFQWIPGEPLVWTFAHQSGLVSVGQDGLITVDDLLLQDGEDYSVLRISRDGSGSLSDDLKET